MIEWNTIDVFLSGVICVKKLRKLSNGTEFHIRRSVVL